VFTLLEHSFWLADPKLTLVAPEVAVVVLLTLFVLPQPANATARPSAPATTPLNLSLILVVPPGPHRTTPLVASVGES
jgi:hypothetical protein